MLRGGSGACSAVIAIRVPVLLLSLLAAGCGSSQVWIGSNPHADGGAAGSHDGASRPPVRDASAPDASARDAAARDVGPRDAALGDHRAADAIVDTGVDATEPFSPASVSGLVLWLDAEKGVTGTTAVSAWADQSGNGNNAAQASTPLQPTYRSAAVNGLPAIHFTALPLTQPGNMLEVTDSATLQWGTGDFYVAVVARFDNAFTDGGNGETATGLLFGKLPPPFTMGGMAPALLLSANVIGNVAPSEEIGLGFETMSTAGDYVVTTTPYNDGTVHLFAVQRAGLGLDLRVDGVSVGTSTSDNPDVSAVGTNVQLGAYDSGIGLRLDGDIAEVLAVSGTLSPQSRTLLEGYELSKYALP